MIQAAISIKHNRVYILLFASLGQEYADSLGELCAFRFLVALELVREARRRSERYPSIVRDDLSIDMFLTSKNAEPGTPIRSPDLFSHSGLSSLAPDFALIA
jgi:hypothetical protein